MSYRRGQVVLVIYPDSNLRTFKRRPALVVQDDQVATGLSQRIVAMITSNLSRIGPTRVPVRRASRPGRMMGLLSDSIIVTDNLATVLEREIDRVLGRCPDMATVDRALALTLGL
jgi:mRNA interferase MazF